MKEDDKWVENLRNKLEDYSEPLPDALWERLEEELSAPRVIPMWRTRRFVAAAVFGRSRFVVDVLVYKFSYCRLYA